MSTCAPWAGNVPANTRWVQGVTLPIKWNQNNNQYPASFTAVHVVRDVALDEFITAIRGWIKENFKGVILKNNRPDPIGFSNFDIELCDRLKGIAHILMKYEVLEIGVYNLNGDPDTKLNYTSISYADPKFFDILGSLIQANLPS